MTSTDHQSGSDRIFEALTKVDPESKAKIIVNVQGDLPTIDPETVRAALRPLENEAVDIGTLTTEIDNDEDKTAPHIVKIVGSPISGNRLHALYFTRATAPYGQGPLYHHIGLYAYRRTALERFVSLGPSTLEKRESLEQLRALEAGMAGDETEPLVEVDRIPSRLVRCQLHQAAAALGALGDRPFDELRAEARTAKIACHTHAFNLAAPHTRPRKTGNKTQLQAADDPIGRIACDGQKLIGVRLDCGKGREITRVDRIRNDLPAAAKIVIGQKPDDGGQIGLAGEPESIHF